MKRSRSILVLMCLGMVVTMPSLLPATARAGILDKVKKKVTDQADKTVDKTLDGAEKKATPEAKDADSKDSGTKAGNGSGAVSSVSTKFDFVPGDSLLFLDDFTQDELGEFPARWRLLEGTLEIAEMEGGRWLRSGGYYSRVRMKVPPTLPEYWTLEFDFYSQGTGGEAGLHLSGHAASGVVWQLEFPTAGELVGFSNGSFSARPKLEGDANGRHHIMFMARGRALKAYVDQQRVASVPELSGDPATEIEFRVGANNKTPMITNVRFAEGCRPAKDMLAEGKLVTYGIHFASGSDVVLPESAPVLRQIAGYMDANPTVKLRITGHTDNVGSPESNLDLSKRRATSVARVLSKEFAIAADRMEMDGKGDTQAVSSNAKPEGRAMNRRVEFAKL